MQGELAETASKSKTKWIQAGLSLFLVYHLFALFIAPNSQTYLGYQVKAFVEPYLSLLEMVSGWNFFAPDPGPPPIFLEWDLLDDKGVAYERGRFPDFPSRFFWRERQNRRITLSRFMVNDDSHSERMFIPYLCEQNPKAHGVRLWKTSLTIPSLMEVADGKRKIGDEEGIERHPVTLSFCEGRK